MLFLAWFIFLGKINDVQQHHSLDEDVNEITACYNRKLGLSVTTVLDGSRNHSSPAGKIHLNKIFLETISKNYDLQTFKLCLDYVIGHEFGHQLEFKNHDVKALKTQSCEERMLLETQADVLAGYLFFHKNSERLRSTDSASNIGKIDSLMTFVYDLGNYEYSLSTHPGYKQRRNAFRHGMIFSWIEYLDDSESKAEKIKMIDNQDNKELFPWSFDISKKIIHYPIAVLSNLSLLERKHLFEDPTGIKNSLVSYEQKIKNTGGKKISLFLQYKVIGKDTSMEYDPRIVALQAGVGNHSVIIKPNEIITIRGKVSWKNAVNGKIRPRLLFPPDNDLLFSADYLDGKHNVDSGCPIMSELDLKAQPLHAPDLYMAILELVRRSYLNFKDLQVGFVESGKDFQAFSCNYEVPGAKNTIISMFPKEKLNSIEIFFCDGPTDNEYADRTFKSIMKTFRELEADKKIILLRASSYQKKLNSVSEEKDAYRYQMLDDVILQRTQQRSTKKELWVEGDFILKQFKGEKNNSMSFTLKYDAFPKRSAHFITLTIDKK